MALAARAQRPTYRWAPMPPDTSFSATGFARLRILCALFCLTFHAANAQTLATKTGDIRVETVAQGFETPWSLAFLPGGHALLSEREGRLWLLDGAGQAQPLSG